MDEPVEVWCSYTRRWVPGFRVVHRQPDGAMVVARDVADPLPVALPTTAVRPASRRFASDDDGGVDLEHR